MWISMVLCLAAPCMSIAGPASPDAFNIQQPDGKQFKARMRGDEWANWTETESGHTIAKGADKAWYYVRGYEKNERGKRRRPNLSGTRADRPVPRGLAKHIKPDAVSKVDNDGPAKGPGPKPAGGDEPGPQQAPLGEFSGKVLFLLAEFSDQTGTYSEAEWSLFVTNNIADFFDKASYGKATLSPADETFGITNNGVVGWLDLGYNHPNTGNNTTTNNQWITKNAILAADPYVDFSSFDTNSDTYVDADELSVVVIVAGYERSYSANYAPNMWGHKWSIWASVGYPVVDGVKVGAYRSGRGGYAQFGDVHQSGAGDQHQATMGIMVHELGHLTFAWPDLYDTDYSSSGIGGFCVMSGGSWGRADADTYSGETPVMPSAWIRHITEWIDVSEGLGTESITGAAEASANTTNAVYKSTTGISGEYFLFENRQAVGYDLGLERWLLAGFAGGVAVWHIDENQADNDNDARRLVDLEEGDGTQMGTGKGLQSDLWYVGNDTDFYDASSPDSKLYDATSSGVTVTNISASAAVMTAYFPDRTIVYVDGDYAGWENGSQLYPFDTVQEGVRGVWTDGQVIIDTNSYNESVTADRAMTLTATNGMVTITGQ